MKNQLSELIGKKFISNIPNKQGQFEKIEVIRIAKYYEWNKKLTKRFNYTYVFHKALEGQNYYATNSTDQRPLVLDGLVGCCKITKFNSEYKNQPID